MCERAEQRSQELEKNHELLDWWKKQGDDLLYSMIPRSIAHLLQNEKSYLNTCKVNLTHVYSPIILYKKLIN